MLRRKFMQQSVLAGAGLFTASRLNANDRGPYAEKPFKLNYAFHDGMFEIMPALIFSTRYSSATIWVFVPLKIMG
jgi:hypothetical protein